ncbi:sce7726 family protein [Pseudomonas ogarae]|uniref:Sce7726 family protein n=1 Tax=Pseudomonas ogarae (strain DSM 112162 / CECT 30235 / F113) TaxID=1114970 RepID=A0ABN5G0J3_PSEO1|nr:sce7726 family protein [Pseudomonas ogarae]AEV61027.1 bacteriophage protein [Pseudomonas ogarae]AUO44903.1 hypothetical protein C1C98_05365 [Pseudomonas ogarae]
MSFQATALDGGQQSAVARLFSAAVIRELAQKGKSPLFARLINETFTIESSELTAPVSSMFDRAFNLLTRKDYRHEYAYKAAITKKILFGRHSLNTASLITEFRVQNTKADIAIFNGTSTAYEIKSERDSLSRLQPQVETYKKFFSKVYVIAGENHIKEIMQKTPEDVGVLLLNNRFRITKIREVPENPYRTSPEVIFDSIQLKESLEILRLFGINLPEMANTEIRSTLREIFKSLDPAKTHAHMVNVLRRTRNASNLENTLSLLPISLHAAVFSTPLKIKEQATLLEAVNTSIMEALNWAR